jgi:hypothetical protein
MGYIEVLNWVVAILGTMADMVMTGDPQDLFLGLECFKLLISVPVLREYLVRHENFDGIMVSLFSRSALPTDSLATAREWFGRPEPNDLTDKMVKDLDAVLEPYLMALVDIVRWFFDKDCYDCLIQHIPRWLQRVETMARSGFVFTTLAEQPRAEAFALNFEAVMIKIANLQRQEIAAVDPLVAYLPGSLTPFNRDMGTLGIVDPADEEEWAAVLNAANRPPSQVSRFFFITLYALDLCTPNIVRLRDLVTRRIQTEREMIKTVRAATGWHIEHNARVLRMNEIALSGHLVRPQKARDIASFQQIVTRFLLRTAGLANGKLPEKPPVRYAKLPEWVLEGLISGLLTSPLVNFESKLLSKLVNALALLFSNPRYIKSTVTKVKIVKFLTDVAQDGIHKDLMCDFSSSTRLMFPELLSFYSSFQLTGAHATNLDRFSYRTICSNLLFHWLSIPATKAYFETNAESTITQQFVFYLVDDALYLADQSINAMKMIGTANRRRPEGPNVPMTPEQAMACGNLIHWIRAVDMALHLITRIATMAVSVFHEPGVLDDLSKLLLCCFNAYANHRDYFWPANLREATFDSRPLLTCLMEVAIAIDGDATIVDHFVDDPLFPAGPIVAGVSSVAAADQIDGEVMRKFGKFVRFVEEREAAVAALRIDLTDTPQEFLDALTYELMRDPVRLPSGNVLDRGTVTKIIMSRPVDPFTLNELRIEDCLPDEELGRQIAEYVRRKRAELKKP